MGHLASVPWETILSAAIPVRTLEGTASVEVPAGALSMGINGASGAKVCLQGAAKRGGLCMGVSIQVALHIGEEEERL